MPLARTLNVLIVDDQDSMRGIMRSHLRTIGIGTVVEAASVEAAKEELKGKPFGLILSDFNMEGGTGLDLLKHVRSHPVLKRTPFIMITGNADKATVQMVMQAGVNNYIVKPVSSAGLRQRIEQVLGKLT